MFRDMIDPNSVSVVNGQRNFGDVMSWPITCGITGISLEPVRGVVPMIKGLENWPSFVPAGWGGPISWTLWAGFKVNGRWTMAGFMQFWQGDGPRTDTGAHPLEPAPGKSVENWRGNWAYDGRWAPLNGFVPTQGTLMAFMATSGDARGDIPSKQERTQIVTVTLNPQGSWSFPEVTDGEGEPGPSPQPPQPNPGSPVPPVPAVVPSALTELLKTTRDEIILVKTQTIPALEQKIDTLTGLVKDMILFAGQQPKLSDYQIQGRLGLTNVVTLNIVKK